jgi:F-type H+-transporting ATPase subunit alpha
MNNVCSFATKKKIKKAQDLTGSQNSVVKNKFIKSKSSISAITSLFAGTVVSVIDGVFVISGLRTVRSGALITFQDSDSLGLVLTLNEDNTVAAVILRGTAKPGDLVFGEKALLRFNCHFRMLGHVFDPLGESLDAGYTVAKEESKFFSDILIDTKAPGVISRQSINQPLYTGLKFVDSMVPIGRGQRELIIGDRQTGKTSIAVDTIINQKTTDVLCVYTSIGQKRSSISLIAQKLAQLGSLSYTIIVSASASDHAALQYLAPYSGCAVGEYFRDNGLHSVVIYDDLSKQAVSYRQMALLLRRPPGREAFPGDIFYVHSRLLERGAKLSKAFLGGSLTALPIIETLAGDVSAYIPTNVISITDGQIFLSSKLFLKNIRPSVDLGLSVSRVGSAAQPKLISKVGSIIKANLAVYRELEVFSSFSSDIEGATLEYLQYGAKLIQFLQQRHSRPLSAVYQVVLF